MEKYLFFFHNPYPCQVVVVITHNVSISHNWYTLHFGSTLFNVIPIRLFGVTLLA